MTRFILTLTSCAAVLLVGSYAQGGQGGHFHATCPKCHNCCVLKAECGKEEKSCWEVECEKICIPCVVFPWQKWKAKKNGCGKSNCECCAGTCDSAAGGCDGGCDDGCGSCCSSVNNGARVRTVRKLVKKKYECPVCKYKWEPACCGNGCGDGCCDSGRCDGGCDSAPLPAAGATTPEEAYNIPTPRLDSIPLRPIKSNSKLQGNNTARRSLSDG